MNEQWIAVKIRAYRKQRVARLAISASVFAVSATISPAQADVMEISADGAQWIAGGPVSSKPDASANATTVLTQPSLTAGPNEWRSAIAALSAKYDLSPRLIEALVWQESRWNANAVSPAGARGLAQLMADTAKELGVNSDDPLANLEGGARYLRMQIDAFDGDIEKALAAYNAGPGRVRRANGIPDIPETQNYVASILNRLSDPSGQ